MDYYRINLLGYDIDDNDLTLVEGNEFSWLEIKRKN